VIDPLGYEAQLESYLREVMRGPANGYATAASVLITFTLMLLFQKEPESALKVALCFLGSGLVLDYLHEVCVYVCYILLQQNWYRVLCVSCESC
jgi:hypothetical protein